MCSEGVACADRHSGGRPDGVAAGAGRNIACPEIFGVGFMRLPFASNEAGTTNRFRQTYYRDTETVG